MILEEETFRKFGYLPSEVKPHSGKKILAACVECGKIRVIQKRQYRPLCPSCSRKGDRNPRWGKHHSEEARRKMSEANKGRKSPMKGKHHSDEAKQKMSEANKGENHPFFSKHHTEETKKKKSEAMKGEKNHNWGKHVSEETRRKMRESRKHRKFPTHHTKPELIFIDFYYLFGINDRVEDTSNNSFHIGRLNPDFIIRDMRIAIFVNGDYWHSGLLKYDLGHTQRPENQIRICKRHKWKAVIIWESDLLREDAKAFVLNILRENKII